MPKTRQTSQASSDSLRKIQELESSDDWRLEKMSELRELAVEVYRTADTPEARAWRAEHQRLLKLKAEREAEKQ